MAVMCALKLLAMPAIAAILAFYVLALPPISAAVVVLFAAMPTGANAYIFSAVRTADRSRLGRGGARDGPGRGDVARHRRIPDGRLR